MIEIKVTHDWASAHPGARQGLLEISGVDNRAAAPSLRDRKRELEESLRERYKGFTRAQFVATPVLESYVRYYKRFNKTYHVLLQLESIVSKGKTLPAVSPLVDANFAAELETLVLTAGHDAARLQTPLAIDVSRAADSMTQMGGPTKSLPAGDMVMRDAAGAVCCSILYGQDNRSPISADTTHVLYVAYAPAGIRDEDVQRQLDGILGHVRTFAPGCSVEQKRILRST